MKLTILREELRSALDDVAPAAVKGTGESVTIAVPEGGDMIVLSAGDWALQARADFPGDVHEPGRVSVSARVLKEVCSRHVAEEMSLHYRDATQTLSIRCDGASYKAAALACNDVRIEPGEPDAVFAPGELTRAIKLTRHAVCRNQMRVNILGAYLDGPSLIATDGHRVAKVDIEYNGNCQGRIPEALVDAILRLDRFGVGQDLDSLQVGMSFGSGVTAWSRGRAVRSNAYESNYPDVDEILGRHKCKAVAKIDARELECALRRVMVGADSSPCVVFDLAGNRAGLSYGTSDGTVASHVDVDCETSAAAKFAINGRYIHDAVTQASGQVTIETADESDLIMLRCEGALFAESQMVAP